MCVSRSREGRAWACLARLGATTLPPPLALVVLRAGHPAAGTQILPSDPYDVRLQVVLRCQLIPLSTTFQAGENPRGSASSNSYHTDVDDVGTREGWNVRGTTRVMDWHWHWHGMQTCAMPHPTAYSTLVFPVAQVVPVNSVFQSLLSSLSCVVLPNVKILENYFYFFWH